MNANRSLTGGARLGFFNATWPFAKLTATEDSLTLKVAFMGSFTFTPDQVVRIDQYVRIPFAGWGIRIQHDVPHYPSKIIFWYLGFPSTVFQYIKDSGFPFLEERPDKMVKTTPLRPVHRKPGKGERLSDRELPDALDKAEEAGHVASVRQLCEAFLFQRPDHGPTLVRYARALIDLALYDEAAVVLDRAEAVVPGEWRHLILAQRGHRLERMGNFSASEELYLKAHELDPENATHLVYAASVAFRRGDLHRAEELARKATSCREGSFEEAYCNLGGYLLTQRRYMEARDCYLRALEIDPAYAIAKKNLADAELAMTLQNQ